MIGQAAIWSELRAEFRRIKEQLGPPLRVEHNPEGWSNTEGEGIRPLGTWQVSGGASETRSALVAAARSAARALGCPDDDDAWCRWFDRVCDFEPGRRDSGRWQILEVGLSREQELTWKYPFDPSKRVLTELTREDQEVEAQVEGPLRAIFCYAFSDACEASARYCLHLAANPPAEYARDVVPAPKAEHTAPVESVGQLALDEREALARNIRRLFAATGWTQLQLATKMRLDERTVRRHMFAKTKPDWKHQQRYIQVFTEKLKRPVTLSDPQAP